MSDTQGQGAGAPPATPPAAGPASGATAPDYETRLKSDPSFAASEAKNHASRADRAEAEAKELKQKLEGLDGYFKSGLNGKTIAGHLGTLERMLADQAMGGVVRNFVQTGKLELPKGSSRDDDDDEYLSDEQKEIRELKQRLAGLESGLHGTTTALGQQAVTRNMEQVIREIGLSDTEAPKVKERVLQIVGEWGRQGEAGRRALESLRDPEKGLATARTLVMEGLGIDGIKKAVRAEIEREMRSRQGLATDVPSRGLGLNESIPEFNSIEEAFRFADANPDVLDRMGYGRS